MATPQMGVFSSDSSVSAKPSDISGSKANRSSSETDFSDSFEQAMSDVLNKDGGIESPLNGTVLPGELADGQMPEGFMAELEQTLEDYFAQLGDLDSMSEEELMSAFQDLSQKLAALANSFGMQMSPSEIQNTLTRLSDNFGPGGQQGLVKPLGLLGQGNVGLNKEGSSDVASDSALLSSFKLLKQSVQSENFASSSVVDGLKSMLSSSAATGMSMSLDDVTNNGSQAPLQMYNQPQSPAIEDAELSLQKIPVPPSNRQFTQELSERIMVMSSKNIQSAEIQLSPPELGALMVKINVEGDQASVVFSSPNVGVREALEQQSFRLKEMMEENGVDLVDVDVSDQQKDDSRPEEMFADEHSDSNNEEIDDTAVMDLLENLDKQKSVTASMKLVDYYA